MKSIQLVFYILVAACVFLKLKNKGRLQLKQTEIYVVYPSLNLNE